MRKLKVALTLLFAMCFSLFLFACGGNKSGVKSVSVEGAKTSYIETDKKEAFTTEGLVVKVIYKEDMKKDDNGNVIPVELKADEYTVDSSAIQWGNPGTYVVKVTPNGQKENDPSLTEEVYGSYEVTIEHAYGSADAEGWKTCSVCGAKILNATVDDTVEIAAWGGAPTVDKDDKSSVTVATGTHYATYGAIGIGQRITIKGTAIATESNNPWYFPILGIANGMKGFVVRNDNWVIYDGPGSDFQWPNHGAGAGATAGTAGADSAEWDVYGSGTTCATADYASEAQIELTWNYRTDGIVQLIFNNITAGKKNTYEVKVPAATYTAVLYGEFVKMHVTEIEKEYNLSIQDFEMLTGPSKLAYAENNMFSDAGITTKATYNKGIESSITTYDLYADIVTGSGENEVTTRYDLRTTPLTANMTNFRLEFSGYSIDLDIEVTPSVIKGVQADWPIEIGGGVLMMADDVDYVYDVNTDKEITLFASGTASKLPAEWKDDLPAGYDYYITFRLLGVGKNIKTGGSNIVVAGDDVVGNGRWIVPTGKPGYGEFQIAVKADAEGVIAPFTITLKEITTAADNTATPPIEEVTADRVIKVDTSALAIPAVSSLQEGVAYIDNGGEITVTYEGEALEGDISGLTFWAGTGKLTYAQLDALNATSNAPEKVVAVRGSVEITGFDHDDVNGVLVITYKLLAPTLSESFQNKYEVSIREADGTVLAGETLRYTYAMEDDSDLQNGYVKLSDNVYAKVDGKRLILVSFNTERDVKANAASDIKLNVQNEKSTMYDLSVKALAGNVAEFVEVNDLTKEMASARVSILGTVGNDSDYDRGAALITVVDVSTIGIRSTDATATQDYYFELPGGSAVAGYTLGKVEGNEITLIPEVIPSGDPAGTLPGDCLVGTISYYEYLETGFYYGKVGGGVGDGEHAWANGVCSKCGSRQYAETTKNMEIAAFNEDIISRGLTLSFDVKNATGDWGSAVLTTVDNYIVTLPNLDPWNNTSGPLASANKYPTAVSLHNGAIWSVLLNCEAHVDITISISSGVTYYKDGVKVVHYKANEALGDGTVALFAEIVLTTVKENGFTFAAGADVGTVDNLILYTSALTYGQVTDLYLADHSATALDEATFGNAAKNTYNDANYTVTQNLVKGSSIELFGTQSSQGTNAWDSITVELVNGAIVRSDWRVEPGYTNGILEDKDNGEGQPLRFLNITPPADPAENWPVNLQGMLHDNDELNFHVTLAWSAEDVITVTIMLYSNTDSFRMQYNLVAKTGETLPATGFEVKILNNNNQGTVTHMIYTAPAAE